MPCASKLRKSSRKNMLHAIADYAYAWELWINPASKLFWTSTASER